MTIARHPCFDPGNLGVFTRGEACVSLDAILAQFPEAYAARVALGDPHNPERRAKALALLQALPAKRQAAILALDQRKRREPPPADAPKGRR